jgi:uncharacterized protein (DUF924 family)
MTSGGWHQTPCRSATASPAPASREMRKRTRSRVPSIQATAAQSRATSRSASNRRRHSRIRPTAWRRCACGPSSPLSEPDDTKQAAQDNPENAMTPEDVLDFWFGPPGSPEREGDREPWWRADRAFDAEVRRRFLGLHEAAAVGRLDGWRATPEGALALVLALDQFPRNMFRGTPRAYATDASALAVAEEALARGFDRRLPFTLAKFFYMPPMHSEDPARQRRCVALVEARRGEPGGERSLRSARRHCEIVERFGRFPHRNAVLGRPSTAAELAFLREPDSSF